MPVLSDARHEFFAQEVAKGANGTKAYLSAGFQTTPRAASVSANRLLARANVKDRVRELQEERARMAAAASAAVAAKLEITQQWLVERAEEARQLAMNNNQPSAAVAAVKEIGILSGHRIERRENLNRTLDQLSDNELHAIVRGETPTQH